jgi:hypothetical protein
MGAAMGWREAVTGISLLIAISVPFSTRLCALEFSRHPDADNRRVNAILATGEIVRGDTERLLAYLNGLSSKPITAIYLSSPGGSLFEGMSLGRFFKRMRIKTIVEGNEMCASACALAFLGGRDPQGSRWMSSTTTSRLGYHQFKCNGRTCDESYGQLGASQILSYADEEMGAPRQIIRAALETPPHQMYWFGTDELLALGILVWDIARNCFLPCPQCTQRVKECGH